MLGNERQWEGSPESVEEDPNEMGQNFSEDIFQ